MSSHDSDSEKAPSDRAESPDQVERDERQLPEHNPSNIDDNAATSSSTTAQKATKKPKLARSASAAPPEDDYADVELSTELPSSADQQNTDTRPNGGFLNPENARPRLRKMKWTDAKDRQLLIFGLGRDISGSELQKIADSFPEQPTAKAVQERLTKLRVLTRKALKDSGIYDADAVTPAPAPAPASGLRRSHSTTGPVASSPSQPPAKKTRPPSSSSVSRLSTPGTPSMRSSQLPPPSQYPQPPQMSQQPGPFSQTPSAYTGGAAWNPRPFGPAAGMSSMQGYPPMSSQHLSSQQHMSSPRAPTAQMAMPPMGASFYQQPFPQPAPPHQHQAAGMYPSPAGGMGIGSAQYPFGHPQALSPFDPDQLGAGGPPFNIPAQVPAGSAFNPAGPDVVEPAAEEEDDDPYENPEGKRSELAAKKAKQEAEKRAHGR